LNKPKAKPSKIITLRIPLEAYERLEILAVKEMRTMTGLINVILREYLEKN